MTRSRTALAAVALAATAATIVFAVLYLTKGTTTTVVSSGCGEQRLFGHINALSRQGRGLVLRFDPALFTSSVTANTAAAEDGVVPKGQPVPNDNYVVEEGHRLLSYRLPASARVTVLTRHGTGPLGETAVSVAELGRLVNGGSHRPLLEPLDSGVWIRVHIDAVCSLDQQYRP